MRWRRWAITLLFAPSVYAQSGVLTGKALDDHNKPIAATRIYLERDGQEQPITTKTDATGVYRFTVENGDYRIRIEGETTTRPVSVTPDNVKTLDLVVAQAAFFDEPQFTVAGVTDNTYRGGHGSDTVLRSSEDLAKATASLGSKDTAAEAYERSRHPLEAVQALQRAAQLEPSEPHLFDWGTELLAHRAPQAAGEVFEKGVRLFPTSVRMLLGLATADYEGGSYEQAAQWFFRATDLTPSDPQPYLFLGKVQAHEITQSPGYQERMERFARLQPANAWANYYYATCLWSTQRSLEAKPLLEKAISLEPHLAVAFLQLGIIQAAGQNTDQAIIAYNRAIQEDPSLEEAHYRLSNAYRKMGDKAKAEQELALYRELSKHSTEKRELERREVQQFVIALRQTGKTQ